MAADVRVTSCRGKSALTSASSRRVGPSPPLSAEAFAACDGSRSPVFSAPLAEWGAHLSMGPRGRLVLRMGMSGLEGTVITESGSNVVRRLASPHYSLHSVLPFASISISLGHSLSSDGCRHFSPISSVYRQVQAPRGSEASPQSLSGLCGRVLTDVHVGLTPGSSTGRTGGGLPFQVRPHSNFLPRASVFPAVILGNLM